MNTETLIEKINAAHGGRFGTLRINTEQRMNKGRGENRNPLAGSNVRKEYTQQARLVRYAAAVNGQRERAGEAADFEAKPLREGESYIDGSGNRLVYNANTGKTYLQFQPTSKPSGYVLTIDGQTATDEQAATVNEWTPKRNVPSNGAEWRRVDINNIVSFDIS